MVRIESRERIARDICRYVTEIEDLRRLDTSAQERTLFLAESMLMTAAVTRCIDLAKSFLSSGLEKVPYSYRECLDLILKNGVIEPALHQRISALVDSRNRRLSHHYERMSAGEMSRMVSETGAIRDFTDQILHTRVIPKRDDEKTGLAWRLRSWFGKHS
jgi:uncharacterized protein YutE (UPF0331/DUF86 family)